MGKFRIKIEKQAEIDIRKHHKSGNRASIKKIGQILSELSEHPYSGLGQPEELKYNLQGLWSRKVNKKDRIIYCVNEDVVTVFVFSAMGHYSDK
jgi:toxin YoeB